MSRATQSIFGLCGVVLPFAGIAAPDGWMFCHGQAVSRTSHAHLFQVIGTTYGAGDGSTTFNLPDLRGRVAAGRDNMGGTAASRLTTAGAGLDGATLGAAGGAQTHTLSTAQMPTHSHGASDSGHSHSVNDPTHAHSVYDPGHTHQYNAVNTSNGQGSDVGVANDHYTGTTTSSATGIGIYAAYTGITLNSAAANITIGSQGGGGAHNNTQPTIVLNHIIKT